MQRGEGGSRGSPPGAEAPGAAAARALEALVPALRFAVKDGFAGAGRLAGFGGTVHGAVALARELGAGETPVLRRIEV